MKLYPIIFTPWLVVCMLSYVAAWPSNQSSDSSSSTESEEEVPSSYNLGFPEVQALEAYLLHLGQADVSDNEQLIGRLEVAVPLADTLRGRPFDQIEENLRLLADSDQQTLREMVDSISSSAVECDADTLRFLELLRDRLTFPNQLLNRFAVGRIDACKDELASELVPRVTRYFDKFNSRIFEFLIELARIIRDRQQLEDFKKNSNQEKEVITINEAAVQNVSNQGDQLPEQNQVIGPNEAGIRSSDLARMNLDPENLMNLVKAISVSFQNMNDQTKAPFSQRNDLGHLESYYRRELAIPCDSLVQGSAEIMEAYGGSWMTTEALSRAFSSRCQGDELFSIQLEVLRICMEIKRSQDALWLELKKMYE